MASGASAQYVIDIAARMTGAAYTGAQLDELTRNLTGAGKGAAHFGEAVAQLTGDLAAAKAANTNANAEFATATTEFRQLEKAAQKAGIAFEKASAKGVVPKEVADRVLAANTALEGSVAKLRGLEAAAAATTAKENGLAKSLDSVRLLSAHTDKTLSENAERFSQVRGAIGNLGGPLGQLGSRVMGPVQGFELLQKSVGASRAMMLLGAAAAVAFVAAVVAISVAVAAATVSVAKWALALADANRNQDLTRQAFAQLNPTMAGAQQWFDVLNETTGLTDDRLRSLTDALKTARVSTAQFPAALQAAALAEAALGQGGAQKFIDKIAAGTLTVKKFAAESQRAFGGIVAQQMLGIEAQSARLKYNLSATFGALKIDSALEGLQVLVQLFDQSTASGQALQLLFGAIFQPLIDKVKIAAQLVEAFVLGLEIGLLKMYLFVRPALRAVSDLFGFNDLSLADVCAAVTAAAKYLAPVFAIAAVTLAAFAVGITALIAIVGVVSAAVTAFTAALALLPVIIWTAIQAGAAWVASLVNWKAGFDAVIGWLLNFGASLVSGFVSIVDRIVATILSIDWVATGDNMIAGMVRGVTGAAGRLVDAMGGAVLGAINKAKSLLGIASPSKVFALIGKQTTEGFSQGVEGGAVNAQDAMAAVVEPPQSALAAFDALSGAPQAVAPAAPAAKGGAPASGSGASINLAGATITFNGVADGPSGLKQFAEWLTSELEGDAMQVGAAIAT